MEKGIIYENNETYYDVMDYFLKRDSTNTNNLAITDAMWFSCNLNCVYCMQQNTPHSNEIISYEQRVQLWKRTLELFNSKSLSVCLFGGEPFFDIEYIENLLKQLYEDGYKLNEIFAVTNGTLINDRAINLINNYQFSSLQITLDGTKDIHDSRRKANNNSGSFDIIIGNIEKLLKETDVSIIINTVIDKINYNNYMDLIDFLHKKFEQYMYGNNPRIIFNLGNECNPYQGCDFTQENSLHDSSQINSYYSLLDKLIDKNVAVNMFLPAASCIRDNFSEIVIGPDGSFYDCISGIGLPEFKICMMYDLINSPIRAISSIAHAKASIKTQNCRSCIYYGMCNGGCHYDKIINGLSSSCQKGIFNQSIDSIINIISKVEEINRDVYRKVIK